MTWWSDNGPLSGGNKSALVCAAINVGPFDQMASLIMSQANAGSSSSTVAVIGSQRRNDVAAINAVGPAEAVKARKDFVAVARVARFDRA